MTGQRRFANRLVGFAARLMAAAICTGLGSAQAQSVSCPASVRLLVKRIAPFAPDGAEGSIRGFAQVFSPRRVRLVGVEVGWVRDGETAPSFPLEPDDLNAQLGRRSVFSLWNGALPAPEGVLHLVCEYEAGLVLSKPVGGRIRRCELDTAIQGKSGGAIPAKTKGQAGASKKDRAAQEAEQAARADSAAFPTETGQVRPVATRAVLSCR